MCSYQIKINRSVNMPILNVLAQQTSNVIEQQPSLEAIKTPSIPLQPVNKEASTLELKDRKILVLDKVESTFLETIKHIALNIITLGIYGLYRFDRFVQCLEQDDFENAANYLRGSIILVDDYRIRYELLNRFSADAIFFLIKNQSVLSDYVYESYHHQFNLMTDFHKLTDYNNYNNKHNCTEVLLKVLSEGGIYFSKENIYSKLSAQLIRKEREEMLEKILHTDKDIFAKFVSLNKTNSYVEHFLVDKLADQNFPDRVFILNLIEKNKMTVQIFSLASYNQKHDKNFILEMLSIDKSVSKYIDSDRDFMIYLMKEGYQISDGVINKHKHDKEFMDEAIKCYFKDPQNGPNGLGILMNALKSGDVNDVKVFHGFVSPDDSKLNNVILEFFVSKGDLEGIKMSLKRSSDAIVSKKAFESAIDSRDIDLVMAFDGRVSDHHQVIIDSVKKKDASIITLITTKKISN